MSLEKNCLHINVKYCLVEISLHAKFHVKEKTNFERQLQTIAMDFKLLGVAVGKFLKHTMSKLFSARFPPI